METKPFNLQAPEQIAKDYMGNKQKIAAAAQAGTLDPTAAVLAGMFIDRMRSAAMQEQQPARTVAQDVLSPPQMGVGAPPPGMPPMGAPPMGAPPPMGMPPQMGAGPAGPMGGMGAPTGLGALPPGPPAMAGGGLVDLPVRADTFPDANYAGGGMVAFAAGTPRTGMPGMEEEEEEEVVVPAAPAGPRLMDLTGAPAIPEMTPEEYMAQYAALAGPQTARREQTAAYYEGLMSPEAQAKSRKEDLYTMLAQIGFGMAGTNSPSFLQAAGQAANAAIPGAVQARKERKAEQRQGLAALTSIEEAGNAERRAAADYATAARQRDIARRDGVWSTQQERDFQEKRDKALREHQLNVLRIEQAGANSRAGGDRRPSLGEQEVAAYAAEIRRENPDMPESQVMANAFTRARSAESETGFDPNGDTPEVDPLDVTERNAARRTYNEANDRLHRTNSALAAARARAARGIRLRPGFISELEATQRNQVAELRAARAAKAQYEPAAPAR